MKYTVKWFATTRVKNDVGGSVKTDEHGEETLDSVDIAVTRATLIAHAKMDILGNDYIEIKIHKAGE